MATEGAYRVTSLPAWTPAFIRRHPALLVEWLRLANSLSRWRGEGRHAAAFVLCVVVVLVALLVAWSGHAAGAIETLAGYWVLLAVVAALYAATSVSRRRRQLEEASAQSWLVATPIPPRSLFVSQAIRVLLPLAALVVAGAMFPMLVALSNDGLTPAATKVSATVAGGLITGGIVGWWTGRRAKRSGSVPSRYVPRAAVRSDLRPDATALASWPIAQVLAWSRPENSRYVLITALLAVQGGSSAITGLSVVATYFVASYLGALLLAMPTVARSAAAWLRATPITLAGFVWSLSRRALMHQLIGVALAIACMIMLGAPIGMALEVAALWLGLFISISGFALVDSYRARSPLVKIALSVAAFAALAAVVQLRAGARS